MKQRFNGWRDVAARLKESVQEQQMVARERGENACRLNAGQRASLLALGERLEKNGVIIADEVGMGKTRIAVELARGVIASGGRVAILVPPGLGYQWQAELRDGNVDAPSVLRSLWAYLEAWKPNQQGAHDPWFERQVVVVSHAFSNWRLGEEAQPWRWALLPELYAQWRKRISHRLPRGYCDNDQLSDQWVTSAAKSICEAIPTDDRHRAWQLLNELSEQTPWPGALQAGEYRRDRSLRPWLERAVGLGLGIFDLIIVDEAHKSRGHDSGLSRLLDQIIMPSDSARRFAMTATPVELDVSQWEQSLSRIGLDEKLLSPIKQAVVEYDAAVKRVRMSPASDEARRAYKQSAAIFQQALTPYLLRRDKREDPAVQLFAAYTKLPINAYRQEREIQIETSNLSPRWKRAVCAAEALSVVTSMADDSTAKRLRLTFGNGHGIAALLDQIKRDVEADKKQEQYDAELSNGKPDLCSSPDLKRQERARWWLGVVTQAFENGDDALFFHPAIMSAVVAIEEASQLGEKVLVFGRFTRPLRALVDLLNAREMLRCLQSNRLWPQAKVHGEIEGNADYSEWPAIRAAHRQLLSPIPLEQLDQRLAAQYTELERQREKLRRNLIANIEKGLAVHETDWRVGALFSSFKKSAERSGGTSSDQHPLALVAKAIYELIGIRDEHQPVHYAEAFAQLIDALSGRDEGDTNGDAEMDEQEADELWPALEARLHEEYNRPQGGFARLMFGGTSPESRRMIQLAFNRPNSFPRVLVAQSMVGREGLNLHKACRSVILLHPEWNPGVVEQQIGRVDRVGSHWANQITAAIREGQPAKSLSRIEVRPVVFTGTYDEHHWVVLRERWDDLRAQLHGIVIPPRLANADQDCQQLIQEIADAAPNFSPCQVATPVRYEQ